MAAVIYSGAPLTAIAEAQDRLANAGAEYQSPWRAEVKLYRANSASFEGTSHQGQVLVTVSWSHEPGRVFVHSPQSAVTTDDGVTAVLESKLQSLWLLRQTFKAEGHSYGWPNGSITRLANVFVQGNYKGFLVDIDGADTTLASKINEILTQCGVTEQIALRGVTGIEKSALYQQLSR